MKKVRIEIHLSEEETILLDALALNDGRSRKNFCETEIRKLLVSGEKKEQKTSTMSNRSGRVAMEHNGLVYEKVCLDELSN